MYKQQQTIIGIITIGDRIVFMVEDMAGGSMLFDSEIMLKGEITYGF